MIATAALSYWVITREAEAQRIGYYLQQQDSLSAPNPLAAGGGIWTNIFAYYCLLIHLLVSMFPLRACWAIWDLTTNLRKTARSKMLRDFRFAHRRRGSSTSLSSSETLISRDGCSASSSDAGDSDPEFYLDSDTARDQVLHAIIIPNYKEEMDTLRETLEVLASHTQARNTYDVSITKSPFPDSAARSTPTSCAPVSILLEIDRGGGPLGHARAVAPHRPSLHLTRTLANNSGDTGLSGYGTARKQCRIQGPVTHLRVCQEVPVN